MSAAYSNQGAVFLAETGFRSAALAGVYVTETFAAGLAIDLAGDLAPSVTLAGDLTVTTRVYVDFAGDLASNITLASDLSRILGFDGGIASTPTLTGDLTGTYSFAGDLAPGVTLAGDLTVAAGVSYIDLVGNLTPATSLAGDITVTAATVSTNRAAALMIGV